MIRVYVALAACFAAFPAWSQTLLLEDAYARFALRSGAVYLDIVNPGTSADRLLAASTPMAEAALLHSSEVTDGVAAMRPLAEGLEIPAGSVVALEPGHTHLMLMGLSGQPDEGATFPLMLVFERAGEVKIDVPVSDGPPAPLP